MRHNLHVALFVSVLALPACARPAPEATTMATTPAAKSWLADVSAIADADATAGRRTAITRRLDNLGIAWRHDSFELDGQQVAQERRLRLLSDASEVGAKRRW